MTSSEFDMIDNGDGTLERDALIYFFIEAVNSQTRCPWNINRRDAATDALVLGLLTRQAYTVSVL
jgi:hypothetical protein